MQKILYHGLRWFLALVMILYGLDKIIGLQFSEGIHYFDRPIRALTGVELLWAFFAYSRPLQIAVGLAEIGMAALLLPRRLVPFGAAGLFPILVNVVLFDSCYNVDYNARAFACILLAINIYLLWHHRERFRQAAEILWGDAV